MSREVGGSLGGSGLRVGTKVGAVVVKEGVLPLEGGTVGATATRTVTRTFASTVPPSPLAVRRKMVELEGETVWVPFRFTWPMPSMEAVVAF